MEFSCPDYQRVRKFFLRSDQTMTPASFLHQRSSGCFAALGSQGSCARTRRGTLAQKPSNLWTLDLGFC